MRKGKLLFAVWSYRRTQASATRQCKTSEECYNIGLTFHLPQDAVLVLIEFAENPGNLLFLLRSKSRCEALGAFPYQLLQQVAFCIDRPGNRLLKAIA